MFKKSLFIVFEGIEGSGKTFYVDLVSKYLKKKKIKFIKIREPGGNVNSEKIRIRKTGNIEGVLNQKTLMIEAIIAEASFCLALSAADMNCGIAIEERIPIIMTTTINSTRVNPFSSFNCFKEEKSAIFLSLNFGLKKKGLSLKPSV